MVNLKKFKRFLILLGKSSEALSDSENNSENNLASLTYEQKIKELLVAIKKLKEQDKPFFIYATHRLEYLKSISNQKKKELIVDELYLDAKRRLIQDKETLKINNLKKRIMLKEQLLSLKRFLSDVKTFEKKYNLNSVERKKIKAIKERIAKIICIINKKLDDLSKSKNSLNNKERKKKGKKNQKEKKNKEEVNRRKSKTKKYSKSKTAKKREKNNKRQKHVKSTKKRNRSTRKNRSKKYKK